MGRQRRHIRTSKTGKQFIAGRKVRIIRTFRSGRFRGASIVQIGKYKYLRSPNRKNYILM